MGLRRGIGVAPRAFRGLAVFVTIVAIGRPRLPTRRPTSWISQDRRRPARPPLRRRARHRRPPTHVDLGVGGLAERERPSRLEPDAGSTAAVPDRLARRGDVHHRGAGPRVPDVTSVPERPSGADRLCRTPPTSCTACSASGSVDRSSASGGRRPARTTPGTISPSSSTHPTWTAGRASAAAAEYGFLRKLAEGSTQAGDQPLDFYQCQHCNCVPRCLKSDGSSVSQRYTDKRTGWNDAERDRIYRVTFRDFSTDSFGVRCPYPRDNFLIEVLDPFVSPPALQRSAADLPGGLVPRPEGEVGVDHDECPRRPSHGRRDRRLRGLLQRARHREVPVGMIDARESELTRRRAPVAAGLRRTRRSVRSSRARACAPRSGSWPRSRSSGGPAARRR